MSENTAVRIVAAGCVAGAGLFFAMLLGAIFLLQSRELSWIEGGFFIFLALFGLFCTIGLLVAAAYERRKREGR